MQRQQQGMNDASRAKNPVRSTQITFVPTQKKAQYQYIKHATNVLKRKMLHRNPKLIGD